MTLPTEMQLPYGLDLSQSPEDTTKDMGDLSRDLENMYFEIIQRLNGHIKTSAESAPKNWTPTIEGGSTAGTITYTNQHGMLLLRNNELDIWFRISWTGIGTGAGEIRIPIPYTIRNADAIFHTHVASTLTLSSGYTYPSLEAKINENYLKLIQCGSGVSFSTMTMQTSGELRGHMRCFIENDR